MVRAKFKVINVEPLLQTTGETCYNITLIPVTSGSPENLNFYKWTPGWSILLSTVNGEAGRQFNVGDEFYVDFTDAMEVDAPTEIPTEWNWN